MAGIARWSFRHRFIVLALWLVALIATGAGAAAAGTRYTDDFALPGSESTKALQLLTDAFPGQGNDSDVIVWRAGSGSVKDAAIKDRMTAALDRVAKVGHVIEVVSPYSPQGASQISQDGRIAYAQVTFEKTGSHVPPDAVKAVMDIGRGAATGGLTVELGGPDVAEIVLQEAGGNISELVGLVAAVVILLIAFGSLMAMLLPIAIAVVALGTGMMTIGLISHGVDIATFAPQLSILIGLGVGIDYALFIVTRHRTGLRAGLSPEDAVVAAMSTAGRAVIFAGGTVCIALLGLLVLRTSFLNSLAIALVIIVLYTVAAATTLLPALLGILGRRVLSRRERRRLAAAPEQPSEVRTQTTGFWARWAALGARRPAVLALLGTILVAALVIPAFAVRLGFPDQGTHPESLTTRRAYDLLATGFGPGFSGPLVLVAEVRSPADKTALDQLSTDAAHAQGVAAAGPTVLNPAGTVGVVQVVPASSPQEQQTADLIKRLRTDLIPRAERGHTLRVYVGGLTATAEDFSAELRGKLPLFITVIVTLGALLLLLAFRSLLIPATAVVMNLLAAGATFGVLVAVFQWGWGAELLGAGKGPIEAYLPVFMLAILFGLSMDYQVFLVSRMHEEWSRTRDNTRAVIAGQVETSRVITSAAAIMIFVFGAFILSGQRILSEVGLGLATAIALDAFILRTLLVPTVMHLFGRANWWIPRWLDRVLPHVSVDRAGAVAAPRSPDSTGPSRLSALK